MKLTTDSETLFREYIEDTWNWTGTPLVGGNVRMNHARNGNLTDLKQKGLLYTDTINSEGDIWLYFTEAGYALADALGLEYDRGWGA